MKLPEIAEEAMALNEKERAYLALTLMDTLSAIDPEVSNEEAARRDEELESGAVAPLTQEQFAKRVQQSRRK
jgi:hypothetical protein